MSRGASRDEPPTIGVTPPLEAPMSSTLTMPPPVPSMDFRWSAAEKAAVTEHLGAAIIGGPETVKAKLEEVVAATGADELMIHSGFYRHEDRKRSYEIVAEAASLAPLIPRSV